ncbi:hypothetical protein GCM10010387_28950 [Streptomyces inusitatus]|uniref:Uncharacterized protein n=1 Tax=Streptomyces inusitatus TaxID=68221 RepID=A0A918Q4B2_9ACTN|nr:hypothetical protein [Streptomyces inusitatus]GGZ33046.1 hypothetical protein GCM10010387_28950 [Streptomyces inusitatus]
MTVVRVEAVSSDGGRSPQSGGARAAGVEEAITQASESARRSLASTPDTPDADGWRISGMDVTFGLTPAPGAPGASGDTSFEVRLTVERDPGPASGCSSGPAGSDSRECPFGADR